MPEVTSPTEAVRRYQAETRAVIDARVRRQRAIGRHDASDLAAADLELWQRQIARDFALQRLSVVLSPHSAPVL